MTQMERYTGKENQIITSNEKIILFHGSKSGIEGMIAPNSRDKCDFCKGFELALKTGYDCPAFIKSFMRSSRKIYKIADEKMMNESWLGFHTLDVEMAIDDLKEIYNQKHTE